MPIMDLYALIYSSLNFGSLNELKNINYLLNQKGIVSCLLEAVVSQKIIFPSSINFDQNYASLVALFRDQKAMTTFYLTAHAITSTVLTGIYSDERKIELLKILNLSNKDLSNYEKTPTYIIEQIKNSPDYSDSYYMKAFESYEACKTWKEKL